MIGVSANRTRGVELITDFEVEVVESDRITSRDGSVVDYDLLMLVPPFGGQLSLRSAGKVTDMSGFANVNTMIVNGMNRMFIRGFAMLLPFGDALSIALSRNPISTSMSDDADDFQVEFRTHEVSARLTSEPSLFALPRRPRSRAR
jgi:hypothetical protein